MILLETAICLAIWAANFGLYFALRGRIAKQQVERPRYALSWPTRLYRPLKGPLYLSSLLHIVIQPFFHYQLGYAAARIAVGSLLGVGGLLLLMASLKALGENFMPCYDGVLPKRRVAEGPYRFFKHPIYMANIMQFGAAIVLLPGPIIIVVFALLVWIYAYTIRDENRSLNAYFPSTKVKEQR